MALLKMSPDSIVRAGRGRTLSVLILASALWSLPASGADVFHSPNDDGQPAFGTPTIAEGGVQPVYLYVDGGASASAPGSACDTGAGDEVCGFAVTLDGAGGLSIDSFVADPGADVVVNQAAGSIVINGLDPVAPATGPQRIGVLNVNAASGGSVELASGEVIGADLGSEPLVAQTLVEVPEPSALAMWVAGASLLARLAKGRARR